METSGGTLSFISSTPDEDFMYRIARELDEAGFAVVAYLPDDGRTFAAFSIGLSSYGHPELVVTADCEESARCFLLHLIDQVLRRGKAFREGITSTPFFPSLEVVDITNPLAGLRIYDELLDAEDLRVFGVRPKHALDSAPADSTSVR